MLNLWQAESRPERTGPLQSWRCWPSGGAEAPSQKLKVQKKLQTPSSKSLDSRQRWHPVRLERFAPWSFILWTCFDFEFPPRKSQRKASRLTALARPCKDRGKHDKMMILSSMILSARLGRRPDAIRKDRIIEDRIILLTWSCLAKRWLGRSESPFPLAMLRTLSFELQPAARKRITTIPAPRRLRVFSEIGLAFWTPASKILRSI